MDATFKPIATTHPMPLRAGCPRPRARPRRCPGPARMALGLLLMAGAAQAQAQAQATADAQKRLHIRALAATCTHCHGTDGRAVEGESMVRLAGMPADYALTQLMAFRSGQRPATVMHQLTRGYTPEQLEQLAKYFASVK